MSFANEQFTRVIFAMLVAFSLAACSASNTSEQTVNYGVLVMAHGGDEQWNGAVIDAVEDMSTDYPIEIAFGMADAGSMEQAVRRLEQQGVQHVGVIRLFISGESWYERTRQILGMAPGAPDKEAAMAMREGQPAPRMPMGFWRIDTPLQFHMSEEGLADAEEMDQVITTRIETQSRNPANEVAIILAHGPGDDAENERWIRKIDARTEAAAVSTGISDIRVFTLREDWEEKRVGAEEQIRSYLGNANSQGKDVLVIPYRVMGFGPYHDVLSGLDYRADETGLLPHDNVGLWLHNQAQELGRVASVHQAELIAGAD